MVSANTTKAISAKWGLSKHELGKLFCSSSRQSSMCQIRKVCFALTPSFLWRWNGLTIRTPSPGKGLGMLHSMDGLSWISCLETCQKEAAVFLGFSAHSWGPAKAVIFLMRARTMSTSHPTAHQRKEMFIDQQRRLMLLSVLWCIKQIRRAKLEKKLFLDTQELWFPFYIVFYTVKF